MRACVEYLKANKKTSFDMVELGVHCGTHALEMLENLDIKRMYLIDPYEAYVDKDSSCKEWYIYDSHMVDTFRKTAECNIALNRHGGKVKFIRLRSLDAAPLFPDHSLDFVYIDASHSRPNVDNDINAWYNKVRPGGMLGGHDWGVQDVKDAVHQFAEENKLKLEEDKFQTDWFIIK
jgi:hypothetical protein